MAKHFSRFINVLFFLSLTLLSFYSTAEESGDIEWPQEIVIDEGVIVIYQPQPEALNGVYLTARAAVGLEIRGRKEPVFVAIWFGTTLETDHENRTAILQNIVITDIKFPADNQDKSKEKRFKSIVETELTKRDLQINMDNLIATLEYVEERKKAAENLNNIAPKVHFINEPAVLISIDGAPQVREDNGIQRVINTPYTIIQDPDNKLWYLNADAKNWYKASTLTDEWTVDTNTPLYVQAYAPKPDEQDKAQDSDSSSKNTTGKPPKISLVTEPTELISSIGEPEFTPINRTNLLFMSNTDSDVLLDVKNQMYYILLSGRWYASKSMQGPWQFVPGEELPEDFFNIPASSELSNVRYAVPGTVEAQDAILDAQLPQTATVERSKAKLDVEYDGEPQFSEIESTELTYSTNSATPVIYYQNNYYAVDDGVWFIADTPSGVWQVATMIPAEIYRIPPQSSLYHVTFVHIYSHTPEVVYVGYTQGYTNVYVYHGTVVYGTGYWYRPWYRRYYYPRPTTWGYHVRYSPRWGWSFGLSYSHGPYVFAIGHGSWYRGGWWGPRRYRGYRHGYRHGLRAGYRSGYQAGRRYASRNNIYRSQRNISRTKVSTNRSKQQNRTRIANNRSNNVYADRSGNVHRNNKGNWEKRTNKGWSSSGNKIQARQEPIQRATQQPAQRINSQNQQRTTTRNTTQNRQRELNRSYQTRQRGNTQSRRSSTRNIGGNRRR